MADLTGWVMASPSKACERPLGQWAIAGGWSLLILGLGAGFGQNFVEMWHRWFPAWHYHDLSLYERIVAGESYYTHAPLALLVSLAAGVAAYRYRAIPFGPRPGLGFAVLGGSLLVHLMSCLARVNFVSGFALIGVLAGLVLALWGVGALRRLWFVLFFLVFMVPLPEISISQLNFELKKIAAEGGVRLAGLLGAVVERAGNRVYLEGDKSLVIANVCNGLRTLISVIAFAALYAYVCRLRGAWRWALFGAAIPVAVVSNTVRIVGLIMVADRWSVEAATGWFHDVSGLMILVVAFGLLFGLEQVIMRALAWVGRPVQAAALLPGVRPGAARVRQPAALSEAIARPRGWTCIVLVLLGGGGAIWLNRAIPSTYAGDFTRRALPGALSPDGQTWHSYVMPVDRRTQMILETEDAVMHRYVRAGAEPVDVCIVFSQDNRKGTHPPDVCLEGGGLDIILQGDLKLEDVGGRGGLPCREIVVQWGAQRTYYVYTYKCGERYSNSFWAQQFIIFRNGLLNRNASGALIRISTPVGAGIEEARARASGFMRCVIPHLDRTLP